MIAVASRSFSQNPVLRAELLALHPHARFNDTGRALKTQELVEFLKSCRQAITALEKIDGEVLSQLPELKMISKYGVGLDMLDFGAFEKHQVQLGWTPGVNAQAVAELAITMMLNLVRRTHESHIQLLNSDWCTLVGQELSRRRVGIVGCGHVGKALVKILRAFNCEISAYDIEPPLDFYQQMSVKNCSLKQILSETEIISLHTPLNDSTRGLIGEPELKLMRKDTILINTARGGLVNERAAMQALKGKKIGGLGFDVYEREPFTEDNFEFGGLRKTQLSERKNIFLTAHMGGSSAQAQLLMGRAAIRNLKNPRPVSEFKKWR
jgi:phosphoglycerate dehydrogenase-like enzyme